MASIYDTLRTRDAVEDMMQSKRCVLKDGGNEEGASGGEVWWRRRITSGEYYNRVRRADAMDVRVPQFRRRGPRYDD